MAGGRAIRFKLKLGLGFLSSSVSWKIKIIFGQISTEVNL